MKVLTVYFFIVKKLIKKIKKLVAGNYFYAFLAESAPQTNRDRAFSAPLSFPSPINHCPLFPFPAKIQNKGRSREMQSVVWNPTHCSAQQTLDTSCSSPLPLLHHKVSFSLPVSFFFFFFFLELLISSYYEDEYLNPVCFHRVVKAFLVPM